MLLKNSLESARLVAMVKARHLRGSAGDDGATSGRAEAVVLLIQSSTIVGVVRYATFGPSPLKNHQKTKRVSQLVDPPAPRAPHHE
jgi:hypothetical protein